MECVNFFVIFVVVDFRRRTQLQASTIESNSNSIRSTIVGYFHLNVKHRIEYDKDFFAYETYK